MVDHVKKKKKKKKIHHHNPSFTSSAAPPAPPPLPDPYPNAQTLVAIDFLGCGSIVSRPDHPSFCIMNQPTSGFHQFQPPPAPPPPPPAHGNIPVSNSGMMKEAMKMGPYEHTSQVWNGMRNGMHAHVLDTRPRVMLEYGPMPIPISSPCPSFQPMNGSLHHAPHPHLPHPPLLNKKVFPFLCNNTCPRPPTSLPVAIINHLNNNNNNNNFMQSPDPSLRQVRSITLTNNNHNITQHPSTCHPDNIARGSGTSHDMSRTISNPQPLTIFYGGSVNVYNDVSSTRAHEIMMMASMSLLHVKPNTMPMNYHGTTQRQQETTLDFKHEENMGDDPRVLLTSVALPQARKASLSRFLERRKERLRAKVPYLSSMKSALAHE